VQTGRLEVASYSRTDGANAPLHAGPAHGDFEERGDRFGSFLRGPDEGIQPVLVGRTAFDGEEGELLEAWALKGAGEGDGETAAPGGQRRLPPST
jgi:hypothetical protein